MRLRRKVKTKRDPDNPGNPNHQEPSLYLETHTPCIDPALSWIKLKLNGGEILVNALDLIQSVNQVYDPLYVEVINPEIYLKEIFNGNENTGKKIQKKGKSGKGGESPGNAENHQS